MLDDYKSISFIAGISLLFIVPVGIGASTYSSLVNDDHKQSAEPTEYSQELAKEREMPIVPVPSPESSGGGSNPDFTNGIPLGEYSNPPTTIETGNGLSTISRSRDNFESSIEPNSSIQQNIGNLTPDLTPDYSAPSSSNNHHEPQDNSLVKPLEDDSFLEIPENDNESVPLSSVEEPLFQP